MQRLARGLSALLLAVPLAVLTGPAAAHAQDNGVGLTPALGWSSWSFVRHEPTAATIEAQADAMKKSGLAKAGFQYVNVDDFWYECPSGGPNVDEFGRWVTDSAKFPGAGIQAVADPVHRDGLKFGLYVTPGIAKQAVERNTPIEGTSYHAADIATSTSEANYNCYGMQGIDYSKPGAQEFINSWADQFAGWGVDYVKIDGVGSFDIPDVQAWSQALRQTGRPIHLELSNSLDINSAATWKQYANGWRTGGDIECYCATGSYPLTSWGSISSRFDQVAAWQPYGGPGGFNDYDSLEVGNGANDGLTLDERKTQMSLWSLAASPLMLGTDLTHLDRTDLSLLTNRDVLGVDQDGIDASRIAGTPTQQVFAKTEKNGDVVVGLFNTGGSAQEVSTTATALGLPAAGPYLLDELWSHRKVSSGGVIAADVPAHGVALFRISRSRLAALAPPSTTAGLAGLATVTAGQPATATASFTNHGVVPVQRVRLALTAPRGWKVTATSATTFPTVAAGQTIQAGFRVTAPTPAKILQTAALTATADYRWHSVLPQRAAITTTAVTGSPVSAPYRTFSSATDGPAAFAQSGDQLGVSGAGGDIYSSNDAYTTVYQPGAVGPTATVQTQLVSRQNTAGYSKAGIIVRNDMTGSGSEPEGVILFTTPSGGIQFEWNGNGGTHITSVMPPNGTIADRVPVRLRLVRDGSLYTGYYSTDGTTWSWIGGADVPAQAATQDAGVFITSQSTGSAAQAVFDGFTVGHTTGGPGFVPYEAEAPANTIAGSAQVYSCGTCSGGQKVGYLGYTGTVTFTGVTVPTAGTYPVTVAYLDGTGRQATVSVNGAAPRNLTFNSTGDFNTVGLTIVPLQLQAGANTIEFANPNDWAPDLDRILVPDAPQ